MIKKPAQHTAVTFLSQRGIGVATLLLVILLFPLLLLLAIGIKVGLVLGMHFIVQYLTGSWAILYVFAVLVGLFTFFGFIGRTAELGRYYTGMRLYIKNRANRFWYGVVFAVDFVITDMLTLTASFILAYVYWVAAATQSYGIFYEMVQPFIGLSILGGLLQILFSAYYLTHDELATVYLYATGGRSPPRSDRKKVASKKKSKARKVKKSSKKSGKVSRGKKKAAKKSSRKKVSKKTTKKRRSRR